MIVWIVIYLYKKCGFFFDWNVIFGLERNLLIIEEIIDKNIVYCRYFLNIYCD